MNTVKKNHFSLRLDQVKTIHTHKRAKLYLVCEQGRAWVTVENDPQDYLLEAGGSLELEASQLDFVVQSLSDDLEIEVKECC